MEHNTVHFHPLHISGGEASFLFVCCLFCVCVCMCVCEREREREKERESHYSFPIGITKQNNGIDSKTGKQAFILMSMSNSVRLANKPSF